MTASEGSETRRRRVIGRVADHLVGRSLAHPSRVAVEGITAAGKTTFADELAVAVAERGRPAIRVSMDGFHHRRAHRHRQGRGSAVGYYQDAYDFDALARLVLEPLGGDGAYRYRPRIIDLATDQPTDEQWQTADADAVLLVDGSFLQRGEVAEQWDDVIWLECAVDVARSRGVQRDASQFGGAPAAELAYLSRYHAAFELYEADAAPATRASIVIGHDDPLAPELRRIGGTTADLVPLFSYGTLQQPGVQQASFGRLLDGQPDALPGHRTEWLTITDADVIAASGTDQHPLVRASSDPDESVPGALLWLTPAELAAADLYEVEDYRRAHMTLASGISAWVYLSASSR